MAWVKNIQFIPIGQFMTNSRKAIRILAVNISLAMIYAATNRSIILSNLYFQNLMHAWNVLQYNWTKLWINVNLGMEHAFLPWPYHAQINATCLLLYKYSLICRHKSLYTFFQIYHSLIFVTRLNESWGFARQGAQLHNCTEDLHYPAWRVKPYLRLGSL